jgi:predicted nucleic acid-binding protein
MAPSPFFVDTNVFMSAVGREHPMKAPCVRVIERIRDGGVAAFISTEIIQEILYRFQAMGQLAIGMQLARDARLVSTAVLPVADRDVLVAAEILETIPKIPARDAFHAATMITNGMESIISADPHFDSIPSVRRTDPSHLA